jgi:hypothetical protein
MNAEEVRKNIQELQSLRTQTRNWKIIMVAGLLIIVIGCVLNIVGNVQALIKPGPKQEVFLTSVKDGLNKEVRPNVESIIKSAVTQIKPEVEKELKKLNDRTPELVDAAKKELTTLTENIPNRGKKVLDTTVGRVLKQQEAALKKDFPNVTEEKVSTLVKSLVEESQVQVLQLHETLFGAHLKSLENIYANIDAIQAAEAPNIKEETPTWDMVFLVTDILREDMKAFEIEETPTLAAADKEKPVAKTTRKKDAKKTADTKESQ